MRVFTINKYESNDGKVFDTEEQCLRWENNKLTDKDEIKLEVNKFLSEVSNYEDWYQGKLLATQDFDMCFDLHLGSLNGGTYELVLGLKCEDGFIELDEDFAIDMEKWDIFLEALGMCYNCTITEQCGYWPQ